MHLSTELSTGQHRVQQRTNSVKHAVFSASFIDVLRSKDVPYVPSLVSSYDTHYYVPMNKLF